MYYAGGLVGLSLQSPPAIPSVLWPPNAVLTAALLLAPRRYWSTILLGALAAHLVGQAPTEWSPTLVLALFATNAIGALLAAILLRRLSDEPLKLDTCRRFCTFVVAVVIAAPLASTFADAAVVALLHGDSYWMVWGSRLPSNVLAQLTVTPAAIAIVRSTPSWFRPASIPRRLEAAALGTCLVVSCALAFGIPLGRTNGLAVSIDTRLLMQLPFVLWAALRFGPAAASLALLAMTCMAGWSVVAGGAPGRAVAPEQVIFIIQMFAICAASTLIGVASLIEERRQSMHAVSERLRFEKLLFEFTRTFVQVPSEKMDAVSREWLERIGSFLAVEWVRVFQVVPQSTDFTLVSEWRRPGPGDAPPIVFSRDFPWIVSRVVARQPVIVPRLSALPVDAVRDRDSLIGQGYNALLVMPLLAGEHLVGALAFGAVAEHVWTDEVIGNLSLMSEVMANALARRQTGDKLRASEMLKSGILDSLTSGVAVIDADGLLLDVNANWPRLVEASRILPYADLRVGQACSNARHRIRVTA